MGNKTIFISTTTPPVPVIMKHLSTDWEVATDVGFNYIIKKLYNETINLKSLRLELENNKTYYLRYRYNYNYGPSPWYVKLLPVCSNYIVTPTLSVSINAYTISLQSSPYIDRDNLSHQSTDWIIANTNGIPILQSLSDTINLTNITLIPSINLLTTNNKYLARVRYRDILGNTSLFNTVEFIYN